jgi:hypothetical protein
MTNKPNKEYAVNHIEVFPQGSESKYVVTRHEEGDICKIVFDAMPVKRQEEHWGIVHELYPLIPRDNMTEDIPFEKLPEAVLGGGYVRHKDNVIYLYNSSTEYWLPDLEILIELGPKILEAYQKILPKAISISIERDKDLVVLLPKENLRGYRDGLAMAVLNKDNK